ncbi:MAG: cytochrome c oxidase subunit II [Chloroflexi bacterium]|nr:cytochrome c oxidase subunit II [Chloroflexota bacterium]
MLVVALLWAALTFVGEVLAVRLTPFRPAAAEEGDLIDSAFRSLTILSVPVLAFVLAVLAYSVLRFRVPGDPTQDGPAIRTHRPTVTTWLLVTTGLTVAVIIFPGTTGLLELHDRARHVDMVVQVQAQRYAWKTTYPEYGFSTWELVLPVGRRVRVEVTSTDVIHSFWVPAFRMKVDAVPGLVTTTVVTPSKAGSFQDDPDFRIQCTELCGVGHSVMRAPVRVVELSEFEAWVAQQSRSQ